MKIVYIAAAFLAGAASLAAQTASEYFMLGNGAYVRGDYAGAAKYYRDAIAGGGNSAELYFNAANACAKTGKKGEAALNYMRACAQKPRLREAQANLQIFAKDNGIALPEKTAVDMYLLELSSFEWTAIAVCAFWASAVFLIVPLLYGKKNAAYIFAALVCAIITAASIYSLCRWNSIFNTAVALCDDVELRYSPTANAPIAARVGEGTLAKIEARRGGFAHVRTQSGKRGWADTSKFAPVGKK